MKKGRSILLFSPTGAGKTTQIGELAKWWKREHGKNTLYHSIDGGGYDSIAHMEDAGFLTVNPFEEHANPWSWVADAATGKGLDDTYGLVAIDSATACAEHILDAITKDSRQIGQQKTQRFTVGTNLTVGLNNEAHYGVVQGFMRDMLWRSSWLVNRGVDVLWTFSLFKSEDASGAPTLGPLLAGRALTNALPKWFRYTFPLVCLPTTSGQPPRHVLYLQPQPEFGGLGMIYSNSRYPLDADTPLPAMVEPASLTTAFSLIEQGQREAAAKLEQWSK
jgi:hypothetical protein